MAETVSWSVFIIYLQTRRRRLVEDLKQLPESAKLQNLMVMGDFNYQDMFWAGNAEKA